MQIIKNKQDCFKLLFDDGSYAVHPMRSLIVVADDESDRINFKLRGSRKTLYSVKNVDLIPNGGDIYETVSLIDELIN